MLITECRERFKLFAIEPYRYFVLSGFLATFGNGLIYIALSWLAYKQMHSISGIALMMIGLWSPTILLGPFFGVCADKYNRKNLLIMSNAVRGFAVVSFVLAFHLGITVNVFFLALFLGVFVAFYMPAAMPLVCSVVPEKDLINANATIDMVYELGSVVGMGMSGFIIAQYGIMSTLAFGGSLFLLATVFNLLMPFKEEDCYGIREPSKTSFLEDYSASLSYLKNNPRLLTIYGIQTCIMILLMTVPILLLPFTQEVLQVGTQQFSILEALFSAGIFLGGLVTPILCRLLNIKQTLLLLLATIALSLAIFSCSYNLTISYIFYFAIGLGLSSWALSLSQAQLLAEVKFQGRLQSTFNSLGGLGILAIYLLVTFHHEIINIQKMYLFETTIALCAMSIILVLKEK